MLPIWEFELTAEYLPRDYPHHPVTPGNFLKKKRMDELLTCGEVYEQLEVCLIRQGMIWRRILKSRIFGIEEN